MKVAEARRAHWSSAGGRGLDATKLFTVPAGTPEHTMRLTEFKKTLPDMEVDTVERVENGYQHEAFSVHAKSIAAKYGTGYDEATMRRLLFHGTSTSSVECIVKDVSSGFKTLLSGTATGAIWGEGTCKHPPVSVLAACTHDRVP